MRPQTPDLLRSNALELKGQERLDHSPDWLGLLSSWAQEGPVAFFESAGPLNEASRWVLLAGGAEQEFFEKEGKAHWTGRSREQEASFGLFQFLQETGRVESPFRPIPYRFADAWFGILGYGANLEAGMGGKTPGPQVKEQDHPEFYFFKPQRLLVFDRVTKELFSFGGTLPGSGSPTTKGPFQVGPVRPQLSPERYRVMVEKAKDYIASGDIYQANLAQSFRADWRGSPIGLYGALREINPGPFMGYFRGRGFTVVSSSPERLVSGQGDLLETKPIAGTRKRGSDETKDLQLVWELKTNPKEQAEHLMLVDLARNDLGRVARYGTIEVKDFAAVESYAKVHHLVSTVRACRKEGVTAAEVLQSLFPGGTITGCPKVRCMEIIQELENKPRGFYTGSMGYVGPGPCLDWNILIRSFTLSEEGWLEFFAGAGIVADSDPQREYMETLYKVEALAQALGTSLVDP